MEIKGELFNEQMVKAFLNNSKIRTSRPIPKDAEVRECTDGIMVTRPKKYHDEYCRFEPLEPKYQPGDIIYVRETWCEFPKGEYHFRADYGTNRDTEFYQAVPDVRWRPSIFMPREAARLFFRVTDVKVQKLEDMTEQDAIEDGFIHTEKLCGKYGGLRCDYALERFQEFWKKQYGTESPWMWVYSLERISKEEAEKCMNHRNAAN